MWYSTINVKRIWNIVAPSWSVLLEFYISKSLIISFHQLQSPERTVLACILSMVVMHFISIPNWISMLNLDSSASMMCGIFCINHNLWIFNTAKSFNIRQLHWPEKYIINLISFIDIEDCKPHAVGYRLICIWVRIFKWPIIVQNWNINVTVWA